MCYVVAHKLIGINSNKQYKICKQGQYHRKLSDLSNIQ